MRWKPNQPAGVVQCGMILLLLGCGSVPPATTTPPAPQAPVREAEPEPSAPLASVTSAGPRSTPFSAPGCDDGSLARPVALGCGVPDDLRVRNTVFRKLGHVQHCYEALLRDHPASEGEVVVRFSLHDGEVSEVRVESELPEGLKRCIATRVATWAFDPSLTTEVRYPLRLTPPAG